MIAQLLANVGQCFIAANRLVMNMGKPYRGQVIKCSITVKQTELSHVRPKTSEGLCLNPVKASILKWPLHTKILSVRSFG